MDRDHGTAPARAGARAFSMIELMTVMAVIILIATFVVPAVSNFGKATGLVSGGNMVVNLAALARQQAMTSNSLSALVLLGAQGTADDYRAFAILTYEPGVAWTAATQWQKLPEGIVVDREGENDGSEASTGTFLKYSPKAFPFHDGRQLPILYHGAPVKGYAARIFLPNGTLQNAGEPAHLRLVEGYLQGGQTVYTRAGKPGETANYYDVALIGATGIAKASRP